MAAVRSLGLHVPTGLKYLVNEGFLPADPPESSYRWETYRNSHELEEILATDRCVVWSRGGTVKKVYSFDAENDTVKHAVLTWFAVDDVVAEVKELGLGQSPGERKLPSMQKEEEEELPGISYRPSQAPARALVIFLSRQAQVYFLSGATHLVPLHFDVERVFPAPRGVVIERQVTSASTGEPVTPTIPRPPPNSFLSPFAPRIGATRPLPDGQKQADTNGLDFESLRGRRSKAADSLPRHFCLTSPLSEVGLIVHVPLRSTSLASSQSQRGEVMTALGSDEELLYISQASELSSNSEDEDSLFLAVTANKERQVYTIWQAIYADSKSATLLFRNRPAPSSGAKTRRRSSFVSHTGATTPAVRNMESFGDPLTVKKRNKKLSMLNASQGTAKSETSADDLLASQIEAEYNILQPVKAARRVSSMISRAELSTSQDGSAFQELAAQSKNRQSFGPPGRRGHSLGGPGTRNSLGVGSQRRLRSSTPGAFSRLSLDDASEGASLTHFGIDDTIMMDDFDDYDDIFAKHSELDSFDFRLPFNGLRRELLFHRITEISITESLPPRYSFGSTLMSSFLSNLRVFTIASQQLSSETSHGGQRHFLHIVNREAKEHIQLEFSIQKQRRPHLDAQSQNGTSNKEPLEFDSFPLVVGKRITRLKGQTDAMKIEDEGISRILCLRNKGLESSLQLYAPWSADTVYTVSLERLRVYSPYDVAPQPESSLKVVGKQRTLLDVKGMTSFAHAGPKGTVTLRDVDGKDHRVQIQLSPRNETMIRIFRILLYVMPNWTGDFLLSIWWNRHQSCTNTSWKEWFAFIQAIYVFAIALDTGADGKKRRSEVATIKASPAKSRKSLVNVSNIPEMFKRDARWDHGGLFGSAGWSWIELGSVSETPSPATSRVQETRDFLASRTGQEACTPLRANPELVKTALTRALITLHLLREEIELDVNGQLPGPRTDNGDELAAIVAQLAHWMGWSAWDSSAGTYYEMEGLRSVGLEHGVIQGCSSQDHPYASQEPPSFFAWLENELSHGSGVPFPSLDTVLNIPLSQNLQKVCESFFPRITAVSEYLLFLQAPDRGPEKQVEAIAEAGIAKLGMETLPDAVCVLLKDAIAQCQATPPTIWSITLLDLVDRGDLALLASGKTPQIRDLNPRPLFGRREIHAICQASETVNTTTSLPVHTDRMWISRLIFNEDRRLVEAMHIVEPLRTAVATCPQDPSWSEAQMLEAQKEVIQWVMTRTFALAPGHGLAHFNSKHPLLTEKYHIHGYSVLCKMQPMGNTVSADRSQMSEDKYGWSWFHAGVSAGLSISRDAQGIDTSWIVFNRPSDPTNRHAGLLLALGLNGHLKKVARWLCFKYLTPKHTMTSIGLLLGLSASHLGSMDTLVTRLLSVHITRMLPPGAAELNLSPLTQTAGIMGIGLLYYGTQHRRMSEVMLSEIENIEIIDPAENAVNVRDESYRLAAGFALGYINLGRGGATTGLNDMRIIERLLVVAVGPRPVDLVHLLDQATAGAIIAIALIFMKTGNKTVARKVDVPDTLAQFDYVRPDVLLLRTLAKHLILWDDIRPESRWIARNLPIEYSAFYLMKDIQVLRSEHMPFYYILAGLLWSVGLKYAGSGNKEVCAFLVNYLDRFIKVCRLPAHRYDARLTCNTIRNCQDLIALACATVMAGTGDLDVMRRLRMLHGRTNAETPYGSHLAAHMAMGALFLGAGTFTFGTSNLAIASLICAFYPLFPMDVTDNKAHLQPLRHFWVLAVEARCAITREVDSNRPIKVPLTLKLRDGSVRNLVAPCLLPEIQTIAQIETSGTEHWPLTLDFERNAEHLRSFHQHQTLYVRKRPAGTATTSTFTTTLLSLNDAQSTSLVGARKLFRSIFKLPFFHQGGVPTLEDIDLILPSDVNAKVWKDGKSSVVDAKLMLMMTARDGKERDALWGLRVLFKWAEDMEDRGFGGVSWLGKEVIRDLRGMIEARGRTAAALQHK